MKTHIPLLKTAWTIVLFLLLSFSTAAQIKEVASVEGITEYQLNNGLKVLLFPDNSAQTITVNMTNLVGSRHEGYGEKGMAHLLEHLLFKGTPNHPNIPEELSSHGARPNGSTYYDRTNYFETFSATDENLDWALDLEADRMVNSNVAKKDLESEFSVVRNEFETRENSPANVLMEKVINASYLWHNYGKTTIGNKSDIERVPIENLKAFYKKYYRPDNAVLMVTGKFDKDKTLALIETKFAGIKNPDKALVEVPTVEPAQDGEKRVILERVGDLQVVSVLYHTPANSHEDAAAIAVAEQILTNEPSGRLYKALVDAKKASAIWSYVPLTKEPSFMYINVEVPSDKSLTEAEKTVLSTLEDFSKIPVTEEEVNRAKANIAKYIDETMRNSAFLGTFMSEFIGAGDWRLGFIFRDRIAAMTPDKVNAAIKRYLIPTNRTVGNFIPTKTPVRIGIEHTQGLDALVAEYKGREAMDAGEAYDVSYDNIQKTLHTGTLENTPISYGFIRKNNRGNIVNLTFNFRNGNLDQLMGKGELPKYTAQILNKGTTTKSRQDIEDRLSALKSNISFMGSAGDVTATVISTEEHLMETLALMTDMLKHPLFDAAELEKIKAQTLAMLEESKNEPIYIVQRQLAVLNNKFPKGHPNYAMTVDEEITAVKDLNVEAIKSFHKGFYGVSNKSSVVAIGNIDESQLKTFFENEFNTFKNDKPFTEISNPYKINKVINEKVLTPDKTNAFTLGVLNLEVSQDNADYAPLQMASEIFGGGFLNSRIATRLRQKDGLSYGAAAYIEVDPNKTDKSSSISVGGIYNPMNIDKVQIGIKEELARLIADGVSQEELTNAVNGWVQQQSVSRANDDELITTIQTNIRYDRDMNFQKDLESKVKSLTIADVNKVIKKYFKEFDKWTVVNGGDFENFEIKNDNKKID